MNKLSNAEIIEIVRKTYKPYKHFYVAKLVLKLCDELEARGEPEILGKKIKRRKS